jgi:flagellar hook-length control protein FliK
MEAIVAPSPSAPKTAPQQSNQAAQAGEESAFAPTLNNAINNAKESPSSSSHSRSNSNNQQDESHLEESGAAHGESTPEHQSGAASTASKTTQDIAVTQDMVGRHHVQKAEALSWLTAKIEFTSQQKLETVVQTTVKGGTLLAGQGVEGSFATTATGNSAMAQMLQALPHNDKIEQLLQGHNNDSISWKLANQHKPQLGGENSSLLQHMLENGLAQKAQPHNGSLPQTASASPLSTEKIIAGITELSQQQGNTTGLINTASGNNATFMAQAFQVSVHAETTWSGNAPSLRDTNLSLRQDVQAQFFDARLQNMENPGEQKTGQQLLDGDNETSQNSLLASSGKGLEKSNENNLSQSFQQVIADKSSLQPAESQRPPAPAMPNQVPENELMQQVTQKLRISRIMQNSKMVMRLHPAELGNLKIDIHLKDGSINANIVAQSRQVQEILEKNMPRLRTLMEDQGLVVNEIAIAMEPDFADNFNLFDEQLANQDNPAPQHKNFSAPAAFNLELEAEEEKYLDTVSPQNGVNVTI